MQQALAAPALVAALKVCCPESRHDSPTAGVFGRLCVHKKHKKTATMLPMAHACEPPSRQAQPQIWAADFYCC